MRKIAIVALLFLFALPMTSLAAESAGTINSIYNFWWGRDARADEISFQQSHNTSIWRLENWVRSVRTNLNLGGKYQTSELEGQTVSVPRAQGGGMYLIQNGQRHRVYDYPTAVAFGLNYTDRVSLPNDVPHLNYILNAFPEGEALQFGEGQFADYVHQMWNNNRTEVTEESPFFNEFLTDSVCLLTSSDCPEWESPGISSQLHSLFDWSFLGSS